MHPAASKASPWQPPHFACPAVRMARTGKMHDGKLGFLGPTFDREHLEFHACFPMFSSWNQIHGTRNQFQVDLEDNWVIFHHFELRLFGETAYRCQLIGDFKHQTVVLSRALKLAPPYSHGRSHWGSQAIKPRRQGISSSPSWCHPKESLTEKNCLWWWWCWWWWWWWWWW